jgi:hypothetical protein
MAVLDEIGNPVKFDKIFLHNKEAAITKLKLIIASDKP